MFLDCNHPRFSYPPYIVSTVYIFQYRHDRAKESAIRPVDRHSPERPLFFISYIRNVRVTNREEGLSSTKSSSDEGTDQNGVHRPLNQSKIHYQNLSCNFSLLGCTHTAMRTDSSFRRNSLAFTQWSKVFIPFIQTFVVMPHCQPFLSYQR